MEAPSAQISRRQVPARQAATKQGPVKQVSSKIQANQSTVDDDDEDILAVNVDFIDQNITARWDLKLVITNFYTCAVINRSRIKRILIDGGSCLELIPECLTDWLKLEQKAAPPGLRIGTAMSTYTAINQHIIFNINVANVVGEVQAYLILILAITSYSLILGWYWMQIVKAIGWYGESK